MSDGPLIFGGRSFSAAELELMREIASEFGALGLTEISRTVCELLEWKRPSGGLKNLECRRRKAAQAAPARWTFHERLCSIYWVDLKTARPQEVKHLISLRRCPGLSNDTGRR